MTEVDGWLRRLAGWRLAGAPAPGGCPDTIAAVIPSVRRSKLLGVLAAAVESGDIGVTAEERTVIDDAHRKAMGEVLLLEDMMLEAVEVLDRAGVGHRVLKGSALAHLVHPDPSHRCFGDVDLLVEGRLLRTAVAALVDAGAERVHPPLSDEFDRRFTKSVTLRWRRGTELDLHRTLAPGPFGLLVRPADLRGDPRVFTLAGRALDTPSVEIHLLHGALHVALGDVEPRLGNLRDVALMVRRSDLDVDLVLGTARRWRCEAPVARGIAAAESLGQAGTPLTDWAVRHRPTTGDEKLLSVYAERQGRFRRQALASMRVLPNWSERIAYARAVGRFSSRLRGRTRYARRP